MNTIFKTCLATASVGAAAVTGVIVSSSSNDTKVVRMTPSLERRCDNSAKRLEEWKANYERENGPIGLCGYDWQTKERIWKRQRDGKVIRVKADNGYMVRETDERY